MNWASFGYGIAAAFTWLLAAAALASMIGRRLRTQTPAPAASPPRAPGKTPAAGTPPIPREAATPRPAPLPGRPLDHGGIVTTVDIYADGRTEITDHRKGTAEIFPGECPACQDGACSLCGFYPVFDRARGRVVHRYQECPAHARERQS